MKSYEIAAFTILLATGMPASADLYRWVDERGITHYSDRQPADPDTARKVERVRPGLSVYSPERPLLQVVETHRMRSGEREDLNDRQRRPAPHFAARDAPPRAAHDPCASGNCVAASGVLYPYPGKGFVPFRPFAPHLVQAVLPPGAIAGTINSNGAIPGNSASLAPVIPPSPGPRMRPSKARPSLEPLLPRR